MLKNEVLFVCHESPYTKEWGNKNHENKVRVEQYLGAHSGWHVAHHAADILVQGLMDDEGVPHNHSVNSTFWIRYDPTTEVWYRASGIPNPKEQIELKTTTEAGAMDAYRNGAKIPDSAVLEFPDGVSASDKSKVSFPANVSKHSGTYVVTVNGHVWPTPGTAWPPTDKVEFPEPEMKDETKRALSPTKKKPKAKKSRPSADSFTFTVVYADERHTYTKTSREITEMFKGEAYGKKSKFLVDGETIGDPNMYISRNSIAKRVREVGTIVSNVFVHVVLPAGSTANKRQVSGAKAPTETRLRFINKFDPDSVMEMVLTGKDTVDKTAFPPASKFFRAPDADENPIAIEDARLIAMKTSEIAKKGREGYTNIVVVVPVRIAEWSRKETAYTPLKAPVVFTSFEDFGGTRFSNGQRAVDGMGSNIHSEADFRAMYKRSNTSNMEFRAKAEDLADSKPEFMVPILWIPTLKPESVGNYLSLRGVFERMKWDIRTASRASRGTQRRGGAADAAAAASSASEYSSDSDSEPSTPARQAYHSARADIIEDAANIINSSQGSAHVAAAVSAAVYKNSQEKEEEEGIQEEARNDPSLEAEAILAASVAVDSAGHPLDELIATATNPENTATIVREAQMAKAMEEVQHPIQTAVNAKTKNVVKSYMRSAFNLTGTKIVDLAREEETPYRVNLFASGSQGPNAFNGGVFYSLEGGENVGHFEYETAAYSQLLKECESELRSSPKFFPTVVKKLMISDVGFIAIDSPRNGLKVRGSPLDFDGVSVPSMEFFIKRVFAVPNEAQIPRIRALDILSHYITCIRVLMSSVASVLIFMRSQYIVHGNLRPRNVMFVQNPEGIYPVFINWQSAGFFSANGELKKISASAPEKYSRLRNYNPHHDLVTFVAFTSQAVRLELMDAVRKLGLSISDYDRLYNTLQIPLGEVKWNEISSMVRTMTQPPSLDTFMDDTSKEEFERFGLWSAHRRSAVVVEEKNDLVTHVMQEERVKALIEAEYLTWFLAFTFFYNFDLSGFNNHAETEMHMEEETRFLATWVVSRVVLQRVTEKFSKLAQITVAEVSAEDPPEDLLIEHASIVEMEIKRVFGVDIHSSTLVALTRLIMPEMPDNHKVFFTKSNAEENLLNISVKVLVGRHEEVVDFAVNYNPLPKMEDEEMATEEEEEEEEGIVDTEEEEQDKIPYEGEDGEAIIIFGELRRKVDTKMFNIWRNSRVLTAKHVLEFMHANPDGFEDEDILNFLAARATDIYNEHFDVPEDEVEKSIVVMQDFPDSKVIPYFNRKIGEVRQQLNKIKESESFSTGIAEMKLNEFVRTAFQFLRTETGASAPHAEFVTNMIRGIVDPMRTEGLKFPDAVVAWVTEMMLFSDANGHLSKLQLLLELDLLNKTDMKMIGSDLNMEITPPFQGLVTPATWLATFGFSLDLLIISSDTGNVSEMKRRQMTRKIQFYSNFVSTAQKETFLKSTVSAEMRSQIKRVIQEAFPDKPQSSHNILYAKMMGDGTVLDLLNGIGQVREIEYTWHEVFNVGENILARPDNWRELRKNSLLALGLYTAFDAVFEQYEFILEDDYKLERWQQQQKRTWDERFAYTWMHDDPTPGEPEQITKVIRAQKGFAELLPQHNLVVPPFSAGVSPSIHFTRGRGESKVNVDKTVDEMEAYINAVFNYEDSSVLHHGIAQFKTIQ